MSIKGFKLVTGEEVISESTISGDGRALLKNPMQLRVVHLKLTVHRLLWVLFRFQLLPTNQKRLQF
jgi:hypothetical protein